MPVLQPDDRDRSVMGLASLAPTPPDAEPLDPNYDVRDTEDGGAEIVMLRPEQNQIPFEANLAEHLDDSELALLARSLRERLNEDKQARMDRDKIYADGIKRSGLSDDAPGGATFEGASRVVHPMIAEACIDFAALAMRELFPANGPAKTEVFGQSTPQKLEVGERQTKHLNWQLTSQIEEYPAELEQTMTQLGMGGSQFMKFWNDPGLGRATTEFVPIDDILLPFAAADCYSAARITHVMHLTRDTVEERIEVGMYRDVPLATGTLSPQPTKAAVAARKVEGNQPSGQNRDEVADYWETNGFFKLSADNKQRLPYLVTIDEHDRVLAIYRNWDPQDRLRRKLHWLVEWGFIPWRGAYKIGFAHLIGGLSAAATGALRAFLDSALVNNAPTGVKLKASRVSGQSTMAEVTQIVEIEGPAMVDDIRKLIMPMPFNPPSGALFQLIGWLTDQAKGVVTTAEEKIADASNQMPVGTALALIESGQKVMSSIFARLHRSQKRVFEILSRLNRTSDIERQQMEALGEVLATKEDYAKALSVAPVSDPTIFTDAQRYAQNQALEALSKADPEVRYNKFAIHQRLLRTMRIPNPEEVLPEPQQPKPQNIVSTDVSIMLGQMAPAFPGQDHPSHLEARFRLAANPVVQQMFLSDPPVIASLVQNIKMHTAFLYSEIVQHFADQAVGGDMSTLPPQAAKQVDRVLAAASKIANQELAKQLEPAMGLFSQLAAQAKALMPPPPTDPMQVQAADVQARVQAEQARTAERAETNQRRDELKAAEIMQKSEEKDRDLDRKDAEFAHQQSVDEAKLALQAIEAATPGNQIVGV